jgi:hypothetical protein
VPGLAHDRMLLRPGPRGAGGEAGAQRMAGEILALVR